MCCYGKGRLKVFSTVGFTKKYKLRDYNHDNSCGSLEFIKLEESIMSEVVGLFGLKKADQLKMHLDGGNN